MKSKIDPWSREAQVAHAKTDIESAYRLLAPHLNTHFSGTPTLEDLRQLLRDAYVERAKLNEAIACAQQHFPESI